MVGERISASLLSPTTCCTTSNGSTDYLDNVTQLRLTGWEPLAVDTTGNMWATPSIKFTYRNLLLSGKTDIPLKALAENGKSHNNDSQKPKETRTRLCPGVCICWPVSLPLNSLFVKRVKWKTLSGVSAKSTQGTSRNYWWCGNSQGFLPFKKESLELLFFHLNGGFTQWSFRSIQMFHDLLELSVSDIKNHTGNSCIQDIRKRQNI